MLSTSRLNQNQMSMVSVLLLLLLFNLGSFTLLLQRSGVAAQPPPPPAQTNPPSHVYLPTPNITYILPFVDAVVTAEVSHIGAMVPLPSPLSPQLAAAGAKQYSFNVQMMQGGNGAVAWSSMHNPSYPRDGSTIMLASVPDIIIMPLKGGDVGFQTSDLELAYIIDFIPFVIVTPPSAKTSIQSLDDLLTLSLSQTVVVAGAGVWTAHYLMYLQMVRVFQNLQPSASFSYANMSTDDLGVSAVLSNTSGVTVAISSNIQLFNNPAVNLIAVASPYPILQLLNTQTFSQQGYNIVFGIYRGPALARGTPESVISNVSLMFDTLAKAGGFTPNIQAQAFIPMFIQRNAMAQFMASQTALITSLVFPPPPPSATLSTPQQNAMWAMFAIIVVWLLSLLGVLVYYRHTRSVFAQSPTFLYLVWFGHLVLALSALLDSLPTTDEICGAKPFFFHLGFQFVFGSLLLKIYRLHRIFNGRIMQVVALTNSQLLGFLAIFQSVSLFMLLLWNGISNNFTANATNDTCNFTHENSFTGAFIAVYGLELLVLVYMTARTYKINSLFNSSKSMAMAAYSSGLLAILWIVVKFNSSAISLVAFRLFQIVILLVAVTLSCTQLLIPILVRAWKESNDGKDRDSIVELGSVKSVQSGMASKLSSDGLHRLSTPWILARQDMSTSNLPDRLPDSVIADERLSKLCSKYTEQFASFLYSEKRYNQLNMQRMQIAQQLSHVSRTCERIGLDLMLACTGKEDGMQIMQILQTRALVKNTQREANPARRASTTPGQAGSIITNVATLTSAAGAAAAKNPTSSKTDAALLGVGQTQAGRRRSSTHVDLLIPQTHRDSHDNSVIENHSNAIGLNSSAAAPMSPTGIGLTAVTVEDLQANDAAHALSLPAADQFDGVAL